MKSGKGKPNGASKKNKPNETVVGRKPISQPGDSLGKPGKKPSPTYRPGK